MIKYKLSKRNERFYFSEFCLFVTVITMRDIEAQMEILAGYTLARLRDFRDYFFGFSSFFSIFVPICPSK